MWGLWDEGDETMSEGTDGGDLYMYIYFLRDLIA